MYITGHCFISDACGLWESRKIYGDAVGYITFPDYARGHDVGYQQCFIPRRRSESQELVVSHLLADWWVHYGPRQERTRKGWAYRKMGIFAKMYDDFFSSAESNGLRNPALERDSYRGFSHTMVEYSIDTWISRTQSVEHYFHLTKEGVNAIDTEQLSQHLGFIADEFDMTSDIFCSDLKSFKERVDRADCTADWVLFAGLKKFGLTHCPHSLMLLGDCIDRGLEQISDQDMTSMLGECIEFVHSRTLANRI
ncbi:hypothetical protein RA263_17430 [Pseudomonas syringae pv. tagetis]|uniref:Uncharacterized protein n=1 Tax=Pseudomonas syringae pv. tagetis TaxID=129140 RepID=A0ABW7NSU5_9PSED|nr:MULTISPECIES: hypothetical protein [Pseudomonas syringae group]UNB68159.1 hypothetical protein MME58_23750 [Pseudomonas syringae pv. tagetis]